ncbi:unnamed protein product, partial [Ascophyllum nodosum]
EYKDSYGNITCTDNCDDDQCCDLVVTCGDYACSDGYEYKDDYGSITCTDDCDD